MHDDRRRDAEVNRTRDLLEWDIADGNFGHSVMPAESELTRRYDVSRNVVRAALAELVAIGRVERVQGRGTVFRAIPIPQQVGDNVLIGASARTGGHLLDQRVRLTPPTLMPHFGFTEPTRGLHTRWVSTTALGPLEYASCFVPAYRRDDVAFDEFGGDLFRFLALQGHVPAFATADTFAAAADAFTARALGIEPGQPVFVVQGFQRDGDGRAVSAGTHTFHAARVRMRITPSAPSPRA
ncbi:phosphonate metabolism transcriptional regulator PhnF [Agromyces tropicus]|uniref:Phosphonate metabolism transcriptional regulator PhnF n=1 Tax=Agromyces tropicus TaxID=555371 RepID=A0ABP5FII1_9MICO